MKLTYWVAKTFLLWSTCVSRKSGLKISSGKDTNCCSDLRKRCLISGIVVPISRIVVPIFGNFVPVQPQMVVPISGIVVPVKPQIVVPIDNDLWLYRWKFSILIFSRHRYLRAKWFSPSSKLRSYLKYFFLANTLLNTREAGGLWNIDQILSLIL